MGKSVAGPANLWDNVISSVSCHQFSDRELLLFLRKGIFLVLPLKLRGKDALLEKDALAAQRKGAIIPFPKQKTSFPTLHPLLQFFPACLLALCCFLALISDPFPLTRCPRVTASVRG